MHEDVRNSTFIKPPLQRKGTRPAIHQPGPLNDEELLACCKRACMLDEVRDDRAWRAQDIGCVVGNGGGTRASSSGGTPLLRALAHRHVRKEGGGHRCDASVREHVEGRILEDRPEERPRIAPTHRTTHDPARDDAPHYEHMVLGHLPECPPPPPAFRKGLHDDAIRQRSRPPPFGDELGDHRLELPRPHALLDIVRRPEAQTPRCHQRQIAVKGGHALIDRALHTRRVGPDVDRCHERSDGSDVSWRTHFNRCAERDPLITIFQALERPAIRGSLRVREERRVLGRGGAPRDGVLGIVALVAGRLVVPVRHPAANAAPEKLADDRRSPPLLDRRTQVAGRTEVTQERNVVREREVFGGAVRVRHGIRDGADRGRAQELCERPSLLHQWLGHGGWPCFLPH